MECLGDLSVEYEFEVILCIVRTDDEDLLVSCIDALRLLDLSRVNGRGKEELFLKVKSLLDEASPPVQMVLEDFIEKLQA